MNFDPNFNIISHSFINGAYSCTLATGEKLVEEKNAESKNLSVIRLYSWVNEDNEIIYTKTPVPTTSNEALSSLSDLGVESITAVEDNTITVDGVVYTRDSNNDIEIE